MPMRSKLNFFLAWMMFASASSVLAHTGHGVEGGFPTGFGHPLSGWDHLTAMLAVGIWGGILGGRALWALPMAFPLAMLAGAGMGISGIGLPGVETGIAASALILGLLVAFLVRLPIWGSLLLVAAFAIFHGYAHGAELPPGMGASGYIGGFVLATVLLHLAGIGIGFLMKLPHGAFLVRLAGGAVAVLGVAFLVG